MALNGAEPEAAVMASELFVVEHAFPVTADDAGQRLDMFLAVQPSLEAHTRSALQGLIRDGNVQVNGSARKTGYRLHVDDLVLVRIPPPTPSELIPEAVEFEIIHQDDALVVLSKPAGLVVHPAAGNWSGTLVHGLLHRCPNLSGISGELRPGVVHRLDKDTSGVMVVAKNDKAHRSLVDQFMHREVEKVYLAILDGRPATASGRITLPIGRHPVHRKKMATLEHGGRSAVTAWRVVAELDHGFSLVALRLETGRTHQIRVHMAAIGCPVAGDPVYGKKNKIYPTLGVERQCLHSFRLAFQHPISGTRVSFEAPLYPDMLNVLQALGHAGPILVT